MPRTQQISRNNKKPQRSYDTANADYFSSGEIEHTIP